MILGPRDAQAVTDEVSAGRLYLELEHQAAQPTLTASQRADTKAAQRNLRTRFPNVAEIARSETPDELGGLPQHLRARQKAMRDEAGHDVNATRAERERHRKARGRDDTPAAPKTAKPASARPAGGPARARSARSGVDATLARAAGKGRRRARRTFRQATPTGSSSLGRLALQSIGTAVGLSLLFLLLRDAERKGNGGAVGIAASTFAQTVARLLSPTSDVFGSLKAGQAPALTLSDVAGTGVTDVPVDLTGVPSLTPTPPTLTPPHLKAGPLGLPTIQRPRYPVSDALTAAGIPPKQGAEILKGVTHLVSYPH